jgi:hypothetical protein
MIIFNPNAYSSGYDNIFIFELSQTGHIYIKQLKAIDLHVFFEGDDGAIDSAEYNKSSAALTKLDIQALKTKISIFFSNLF